MSPCLCELYVSGAAAPPRRPAHPPLCQFARLWVWGSLSWCPSCCDRRSLSLRQYEGGVEGAGGWVVAADWLADWPVCNDISRAHGGSCRFVSHMFRTESAPNQEPKLRDDEVRHQLRRKDDKTFLVLKGRKIHTHRETRVSLLIYP